MNSRFIGILCGIVGLAILLYPDTKSIKPEPAVTKDAVSKAFDIYEELWRKYTLTTADKIKAGELKTEQEIWDFIATGQAPARKVAFEDLAKSEQEYFNTHGGWSLKNHEDLLRSYQK